MKKTAAISILLSTSLLFAACEKEEKKEEKQLEKPNTTEEVKTKEEPKKENEKPKEEKQVETKVEKPTATEEPKKEEKKPEVKNEPKETPKQENKTKQVEQKKDFTAQDAFEKGKAFFAKESDIGINVPEEPVVINNENYYKARLFSKSMAQNGGTGTMDFVYIGKNGIYDELKYKETGQLVPYEYGDAN